jgi:hypothetical protein
MFLPSELLPESGRQRVQRTTELGRELRGIVMRMLNRLGCYILLFRLLFVLQALCAVAQQDSAVATAAQEAVRDGQHDFDFEIGTWKTHLKRLVQPLTGSTTRGGM